jgi:glutathione-independent formaldehyde dehydrogenase
VPWGDFNCLRLWEDAEERQTDHVLLADIFPAAAPQARPIQGVRSCRLGPFGGARL